MIKNKKKKKKEPTQTNKYITNTKRQKDKKDWMGEKYPTSPWVRVL